MARVVSEAYRFVAEASPHRSASPEYCYAVLPIPGEMEQIRADKKRNSWKRFMERSAAAGNSIGFRTACARLLRLRE